MGHRKRTYGKCLLLGTNGRYAKAHIIPRFLTDAALGGAARVQFGVEAHPQLLFNSWTDQTIVSSEGEKRLRDIDTAAARIFRSLGLSWRHFPFSPNAVREKIGDLDLELIKVPNCDSETLRLFFLSLLWRSVVSSRREFAQITLEPDSTEMLRRYVLGLEQPQTGDFPCVLLLLTTKGDPQLITPTVEIIKMKDLGIEQPDVPIFRFFLDGLIVHMGQQLADMPLATLWGPRIVGTERDLTLLGLPYEGSMQHQRLNLMKETLVRKHPLQAEKIYKTLAKIDERGN